MADKILVLKPESDDRLERTLKYAGFAVLGAAVLSVVGLLFARDQVTRHRNDLFSPHPLRRLAALAYLRAHPDINNVLRLRDFLAWEERPMLRKRAASILQGMEEQLAAAESVEGI